MSYFLKTIPNIEGNTQLREPQIEAYLRILDYFEKEPFGEALVVLPTGTGKSGLISIAPYGVSNKRVLIITPGIVTKNSIIKELHPLDENFWLNQRVLFNPMDLPVVEEYNPDMLDSSLNKCNFLITNIHYLSTTSPNSLLNRVNEDFFDMVIIDEAHHSPAMSWKNALSYFKDAKKLHVTGTPYRGDGQELPGVEIHNTSLSEVMALQYVKWLRKESVNSSSLYFTMPGNNEKLSKEDVLKLKDKEWIEKSVALSKSCSLDVIKHSINHLSKLRELSPSVPHKILSVACSIAHANDVCKWYKEEGMRVVIIHSEMEANELKRSFLNIANDQCDVVVSVNMLMEGYDHKYLTVLAIFRPYRSLNAFAQVVGRVLRAIPSDEITDFAIDNNAIVIFHEETGLSETWSFFQKEVEKSKKIPVKDYPITDQEYIRKELNFAAVDSDDEFFVGITESYIEHLDFNQLYKDAIKEIDKKIEEQTNKLSDSGVEDDVIDELKTVLKNKMLAKKSSDLDELLSSKRPEMAREKRRKYLNANANEAANDILLEKGLDPKGTDLVPIFKRIIYSLKDDTPNDGVLVRFINSRLHKKFGPVKDREPEILLLSKEYLYEIVNDIRGLI